MRANATDSSLTCSFYRPLSVQKTLNEKVFFYDLAQTAFVLIYEEGNAISERRIAPPNYSVFTPHPITLVNKTLFRQVKGKKTSIAGDIFLLTLFLRAANLNDFHLSSAYFSESKFKFSNLFFSSSSSTKISSFSSSTSG